MADLEVITFDAALKHLVAKKRKANLLLGNGFSMAYDPHIFSYTALSNFVTSSQDPMLTKLFKAINTTNFELLMQYLSVTINILKAFGSEKQLIDDIESANEQLKVSLIDAIQALHPEHVFKVPRDKSERCATFLKLFLDTGGSLFTTNYDLLLYWVLMRNGIPEANDGFGREVENEDDVKRGEEAELSELKWGPNSGGQRVYYVHGALPLFDDGVDVIKEQYSGSGYILENIRARIEAGQYPVFVTAGNGREKLKHIMHNRYLSECYDQLSAVSGSLISFGFNFGPHDTHIIEAINRAASRRRGLDEKLWSIYIGIYSDADFQHIQKIHNQFKCKVNLFDAKTANIWN